MNRSRFLILGGVSLLVGAAFSLYVYGKLDAKSAEPAVTAIVAAKDLRIGSRLETADISVVRVPAGIFPPDAPQFPQDVIGHGVIVPIWKGQFIVSGQLAGESADRGLPSLIPSGMRAVGVPVNDVTSVAGFVTPGTRVDVLMTPNGEHRAITVLQNVKVLATGSTLEHIAGTSARNFNVATLLVHLEDAERLILATREGRVHLVLRNPVDLRADKVKDATLQQLYDEAPATRIKLPVKPLLQPAILPAPNAPEIQIYQGNEVDTVECKDGGQCTPAKKAH